jgi:hypothetical protein
MKVTSVCHSSVSGGRSAVVVQHDDLLEVVIVVQQRMDVQRAEARGEIALLRRRDPLAAEHQQLVLDQRLADQVDGVLALLAAEVDILDQRGERSG